MVNDVLFSDWLNEEMRREEWSQADLARAAGLGPATIYKMLNSKSKRPDPDSCLGIAKALKLAPETVFRAAKILPTEPEFPGLDDLRHSCPCPPDMVEFTPHRGGAREADWARLLSECWGFNLSRGFESHPPRLGRSTAQSDLLH
jgi:transcriptional regulator with XRE-family HTH domain